MSTGSQSVLEALNQNLFLSGRQLVAARSAYNLSARNGDRNIVSIKRVRVFAKEPFGKPKGNLTLRR
jgi:hypothetical protein